MKCHYTSPLLLGNLHQLDRESLGRKRTFITIISKLEMRDFYFFPQENDRTSCKQQAKMSTQICSMGLQPFPSQDSHTVSGKPSQCCSPASADSSCLGSLRSLLLICSPELPVSLLEFVLSYGKIRP